MLVTLSSLLVALPVSAASADSRSLAPEIETPEAAPWNQGISKGTREAATVLYKEGTGYLNDGAYVMAAEKLKQSSELWDHPIIHYNLVLALKNLNQPVESYEHILAALKYGQAMFDRERYEYALRRKTELEQQVGQLAVACTPPDAKVTIDGQPVVGVGGVFTSGWLRAGEYTVMAYKEGYATLEGTAKVQGAVPAKLNLELRLLQPRRTLVHFVSRSPGVTFHHRAMQSGESRMGFHGSDTFVEVCTAPCTAQLELKQYSFGLSQGDDHPVSARGVLNLKGEVTVEGLYMSNSRLRALGMVVAVGSGLLGLALATVPVWADKPSRPWLLAGSTIALGGFLSGTCMYFRIEDRAEIRAVGGAALARGEEQSPGGMVPTLGAMGRF